MDDSFTVEILQTLGYLQSELPHSLLIEDFNALLFHVYLEVSSTAELRHNVHSFVHFKYINAFNDLRVSQSEEKGGFALELNAT